MCIRWRGSMPLNGSSSSSTCGSCTSAAATRVRCRMPLEYVLDPPVLRVGHLDQVERPARPPPAGSGSLCSFALASTNSRAVRKPCTASRSLTRPSVR